MKIQSDIITTTIIILVFLLSIFLMVKKVIIPIIKDLKNYKKLSKREKEKFKVLAIIFFAPIILLYLDYFNVFSKIFPKYSSLSREYDWLSFIGTYSGTIVSAILLIFITEKDREENTAVLRASQRPYLDISYMKISNDFFKKQKDNITVFNHGKLVEKRTKKEYLTLCIKNTGASVAIINTNKTKIKLRYIKNNKEVESEFMLNFSINRLSIKSVDEIYIKFVTDELYQNDKLLKESKIVASTIYYKDLFNVNYYDECELKENLMILHDNEEIEEK